MNPATQDKPAAPGKEPAAQPSAIDNLQQLEQEALRQDEAVASQATADGQQAASAADIDAAALKGAAMAVGFAEALVKMKWDFVTIPQPLHEALIAKAAPVVKKRAGGGQLPAWLEPYREEVELAVVVLATGAVIAVQVKAHDAQIRQAAQEAAGNEQRATTGPQAAAPAAAAATVKPAPVTPIRPSADPLDPNWRG